MTVSQQQIQNYRKAVNASATDAQKYLKSVSKAYLEVYPNASVADVRNYTINAIQDVLSVFGDESKLIANEFFDTLAKENGSKLTAEMFDTFDDEMMEQKVRYYAQALVDGDVNKFTNDVSDLASYYVKREAFQNMYNNCKKNRIRYARVPTGRETCAFCFMLSSRGFVYSGEAEAGAKGNEYHAHCDCTIIPNFGNTKVEGYDPDALYERYKKCYTEAKESGALSYNNWAQANKDLPLDQQEDITKWKTKQLMKVIDSHDYEWLWTGRKQ